MDYRDLDSLIAQLEAMIDESDPRKGYWKELWSIAGRVGAGFKGTRYETKQAKDAAWQRFQKLCEKAKKRSEENRREMEERKREWEKKQERSEQVRSRIEGKAYGSRPMSDLERSIADLILLPITVAERMIGLLLGIREKSQLEEIREELKGCNEKLRAAWEIFNQNKDSLLPADKAKCYENLQKAREKLDQAWARLKEAGNQYYQAKHAAWQEKQQNFRERVHANIDKLEDKLDKARSALGRQEAHLEKLRGDYSNAWNDGFKDRCSAWIDEAETRIRDITASIERMEGWLDEERNKLR